MLVKIKVSSFFELEGFDSFELFENYDLIEELVYKKCLFNLNISKDDLDVYKSLRPKNFETDNAIKQILELKKESIIENIYNNFKDVFIVFLTDKENELKKMCKELSVYVGDDNYCRKINTDIYFEISDEKIFEIENNKIEIQKYVYFEFQLRKPNKILDINLKMINKFESKALVLEKISKIINQKYDCEELEQFIYSGEYEWIERIEDEQ